MRKLTLFSVAAYAVGAISASGQTWTQQTSGTTDFVTAVHFIDANRGWATTGTGAIRRTTDGGVTWSTQASGPGFNSVRFLDVNTGWVGGLSQIRRTLDGGSTYSTLNFTSSDFVNALFPVSSAQAWGAGGTNNCGLCGDTLYRVTFSGGSVQTLSFFNVVANHGLNDIVFTSPDDGWAVGGNGRIVRITSASGSSPVRTPQTSGTTASLNGIHMVDASTGSIVGTGGTILRTTNGGTSWTPQSSGTTAELNAVHFVDANQGWIVGAGGIILATTNGGNTWTVEGSGVTTSLASVFFVSPSLGFAVGANGVILKRSTAPPNQSPVVTITSPTAAATFATGMATIAMSGTASDDGGVSAVSWTTDRGGSGTATGTTSWSIPAITLQTGANVITVTATDGAGATASDTLTVTYTPLPTMGLDKSSLIFGAVSDGAAFTARTAAQAVRLTQSGAGTVTWTAASSASWLTVTPSAGTGPATLNVAVQFAGGLGATQNGSITLTFAGAANTAGPMTVTLNTTSAATATAPQGSFDTPLEGASGVSGSIPVTGWAVDDIEVTRVRILRDPVAGEGSGLVFIGDAVLVDGARPDVQASFPTLPRSSRAGWGYLMLTNFLPGLGNGTFRLHAIADDADGHSTTLGTRTITCNNSAATAPFGAIDTPGQGETITTASYTNFGWVLSPGSRRSDPPSGGAVQVVIDGVLGVTPAGWVSRSDLDALFPAAQFSGVGSALGVATLNIVALTNGVHTISWLVTDNQGTASGIGSRYFTVANSALTLAPDLGLPALTVPPARSVTGRRGYAADAPYQTFASGPDERITIQSEEIDRIELQLGAPGGGARIGASFTGHLRVGDALQALPAGSALDRSTGAFTWQPGVGFVGPYDLVFARWEDGRVVERHEVRVVLNPKGRNRSGPQTIIDVPSAGASVTGPFVLAGWAADLDAAAGAGVHIVHVWAYPILASGYGDPIWIGAAGVGGARPDVAAVYGDRFRDTGYGLTVDGLAPGSYDLAVFAYSTVRHTFLPAKTVRVVVKH